ncbi:uncharacterized protein LOC142331568 [Lycorma delicatula]|uniref:uncharacterized protein LOC142331568 n=1 Tax=Lycorma delicatula TaxID=130591 RepID=UPI003F50DABA
MATSKNINLPMLKECCCGCTLRTGTMIIGFLSLIAAIIVSCITIVSLNTLQHLKQAHVLDIALEMIVLAVRFVQIILSLLLIVGTHKGRASYICPWLVLSLFLVLIESFYLLLMACELIVGTLNSQIFSLCTHISVTIYFLLVVFSHYREIQHRRATAEQQNNVYYNNETKEVANI